MTYRPPKKKKRSKAWLPAMGLTFAVLLAFFSFVFAPLLVDFGEEQSSDLEKSFDEIRANEDLPEGALDYIAMGLMFLVLLGLSMFVAAAFIGQDPDHESIRTMGPHPADKKAVVKQLRKDLKEAKKRAKQRERQK